MPAHLRHVLYDAYGAVGSATPLPVDCGQLCANACCKGDEKTGMLLFPGEALLLSGIPGFRVERVSYMDSKAWLLICKGTCDRRFRPLACRLFPLAPHVGPTGRVRAIPDVKALPVCPLAGGEHVSPRFYRAATRSLGILAQHPRMLDFMTNMSREREELRSFFVSPQARTVCLKP